MELIKITEQNGKKVVSARELHAFLEAKERFGAWFERQSQYGFVENIDFVGCKVFNTLANQELDDFAITIDCAKTWEEIIKDFPTIEDNDIIDIYIFKNGLLVWPKK